MQNSKDPQTQKTDVVIKGDRERGRDKLGVWV